MNPGVSSSGITSVASVVGVFARNDDLRTDEDIGPLGFSLDLDSVTQRAGGRECPAGTTVNGDVLVLLNGEVVNTIDIAPPVIGWKISQGDLWDLADDMRLEVFVGDVCPVGGQIHHSKGANDQGQEDDSIFHKLK